MLVEQFVPGPLQQAQGALQLIQGADHGEQDLQVAQTLAGTQHGTQLGEKDLRVVQGNADAAPAQEGVVLVHREIGQRLVAANVQGAQGHWPGIEGGQDLAVDLYLLLFTREPVADHERHFGAVQADAVGTRLLGGVDVRQQAAVGVHRDDHAVLGGGRFQSQVSQPLGQLPLLVHQPLEFLAQLSTGLEEDLAPVAVDDHFHAVHAPHRQVGDTHHRGDAHGPGQDGHVGGTRAPGRDQARQALHGDLGQLGGGQILADQNGALGEVLGLALAGLQVGEDAPPDVAQVRGPLPQVRVVHVIEGAGALADRVAQGRLGPAARLDAFDGAQHQTVTAEHHHVGVE